MSNYNLLEIFLESLDEFLFILIEFLDILIWPLVIIIVFTRFEDEIRSLINRLKSVSAVGVTVDAFDKQEESRTGEDKELRKLVKELESQKKINVELVKLQKKINNDRDYYFLLLHFERTYRIIFGSQLNILNAIRNQTKLPADILRAMHRRTNWIRTYPFESYIRFLENSLLVEFNVAGNTYSITPLGTLFLEYLKQNKIPMYKLPY